MYRFVQLFVLTCMCAAAVSAQSGRIRSTAVPTPAPIVVVQDPEQYSESKPQTHRVRMSAKYPRDNGGEPAKATTSTTSPTVTNAKDDGEVLRVETNLITIPVSIYDRNGLYIPGLLQKDFKIYEDGKEQEIAYFGATDKPFTVAIMLDTSPSTQYKIEEIHRAAKAFVDQLGPNDSVVVIEFNHAVKVQTEATRDREKIYKAIDRAKFGDGTSLYNAVDEALRKQLSKIEGRKAVVLFTDGVDTTSNKNTYDGTLDYAEESEAMIFPIYFNTYFDNQQMSSPFPDICGGPIYARGTSREEYALGKRYLDDLANVTGGRLFRPDSTPGGLDRAFEGIADELRRQYSIGYVPKDERKVGQRKEIRVRVDRPNLIIRARDSYVVGTATRPPTPQASTVQKQP